MPPVEPKPRNLPAPCWKTSTSTPYAAATESRLSRIALAATTIERKATSISANANSSTNAITGARFDLSSAAESFHEAVRPVTPASAPGRAATVSGTIVSRRRLKASFEAASVPFPAIGTVTFATVPAGLTATVIGSQARAPARPPRLAAAGDGPEARPARDPPPLQLGNRASCRRRAHARCLDDDVGRQGLAREGV